MYSIISGDKAGGENYIMTRLSAIKDGDIVVLASEKGENKGGVRFDIFACSYSGGTYHGEKTGSHEEIVGYYDEDKYEYNRVFEENRLVHKKGDPIYETIIDYKDYPYGNIPIFSIPTNNTSFYRDGDFDVGNDKNKTYSFSFFKDKLGLDISEDTNLSSRFLTFKASKNTNFWLAEPRRSLSIFPFGESDTALNPKGTLAKIEAIFN